MRPKYGKITQALIIKVWNKYLGEEVGQVKCKCCRCIHITQHNFQCGLVIPKSEGGTLHVNNLRPVCDVCISSMQSVSMGIQEFQDTYLGYDEC